MYFTLERIQKICDEISRYVYCERVEIKKYLMKEGNFKGISGVDSSKQQWKEFNVGELWGGRDQHCWFRTEVIVPDSFKGRTVALTFKTFDEGWDAINPQFILYLNGEHIQGLDMNHREVIISNNAEGGENLKVDLHAYSGMVANRMATLFGELVVIDTEARDLFYNLQVPVWICEKLQKEDKRRIDMLKILNEGINILDLRKIYSDEYVESIRKCNEYLQEKLYVGLGDSTDTVATCVGHTHIDVAWHWTVAQTREKVGRSFSTVLKLMDEYPEYIFMSSQPQLYKFLKEDYPQVYKRVKERVNEGRWEAEGAMWLEADCNVTSGESLVRQIIHGKRFFKEEFGVENEILWLPDVFGYSAALPQILKKSDVNYFMTTKIAWNQFNKLPYDTFNWRGIDGTEILTHFITTKDPYQEDGTHFTTYNGQIHPGAIIGAWDRYGQKAINDDVLVSFGFGDGGGGPTYEMLEVARRLEKGLPGCPRVKMGSALEYFKKLEEKVQGDKYLPKWVGELYLEYHRGTYTSMARNKRDNRLCENLYQSVEKIRAFDMELGGNYPFEELNKGWENILLNQFHDILPGSSIKEVYEVTEEEYERLIKDGYRMLNDGLDSISEKIDITERSVLLYNTLSHERDDIGSFTLPEDIKNPILIDEEGIEYPCQKVDEDTAIFYAKGIPSLGYKVFKLVDKESKFKEIQFDSKGIENDFYSIKIDDKGRITSFILKENNRELLKNGRLGNVLQAFEDKPMNFDNWDIDIYYKEKMWEVDDVQSIRVTEVGPVRWTIEICRKFVDSLIVQKIHFYSELQRVDFETEVDWKQPQVLLKAAFPIDINANKATYEIQFGNVERETHSNTSWDNARFEVCGQRWADLSQGDFGVSLLNNCKYGHDIEDGVMRLTLIKSGIEPNPTTDIEKHFFTYSIYPHMGSWKDGDTVENAQNLNVPLYSKVVEKSSGYLPKELAIVECDSENVIIDVVKKGEECDEFIIRMYEYENKRNNCELTFFKDIYRICECNLLERDIAEIDCSGNKAQFEIKPFEIKTLKVSFNHGGKDE